MAKTPNPESTPARSDRDKAWLRSMRPKTLPSQIKFASVTEQREFIRRMRLLAEDVMELAYSIGFTSGMQSRKDDQILVGVLNRHPNAWMTMFAATKASILVAIARIHENGNKAYLRKIVHVLGKRADQKDLRQRFADVEERHGALLKQAVALRHTVIAHAGFERPENEMFGFRGLTAAQFESYWRDLASTVSELEERVLGPRGGPKIDEEALDEAIRCADAFFDTIAAGASSSIAHSP